MDKTGPEETLRRLKIYFHDGITLPYNFRREKLASLAETITAYEDEIVRGLRADLQKDDFTSYASEIGIVLGEIRNAFKHLKRWMRRELRPINAMTFPSIARVVSEPYGVCLIIGPWNFPFLLVMQPLVAAIAAGNCVILKPSERAPVTAKIVARIIREVFDPAYVAVIQGGAETSKRLLKLRFDFVFFTGSSAKGRGVMRAAAEHLTPVLLELGGKNPCIVHSDADVEKAARRIAWGKFLNAGQSCIAPDFVAVQTDVRDELLEHIRKFLKEFYGENPWMSTSYERIVDSASLKALAGLIEGENAYIGGIVEESERYMAPTVLTNVRWDSPVMEEEIFGPVLPVISYGVIHELVARLAGYPAPLALYIFTTNRDIRNRLISRIRSGAVCVNDVVLQASIRSLPFGGVGESGMGSYHGKAGFDAFTYRRSILLRTSRPDWQIRYPPYRTPGKWLKAVLRRLL